MTLKKVQEKTDKLLGTLLPHQRDQYNAVSWLFHSPRASGKTHLLAIVFIIHAMNNTEAVHVVDHWGTEDSRMHLLELINKICIENGIKMNINHSRKHIVFKGFVENE